MTNTPKVEIVDHTRGETPVVTITVPVSAQQDKGMTYWGYAVMEMINNIVNFTSVDKPTDQPGVRELGRLVGLGKYYNALDPLYPAYQRYVNQTHSFRQDVLLSTNPRIDCSKSLIEQRDGMIESLREIARGLADKDNSHRAFEFKDCDFAALKEADFGDKLVADLDGILTSRYGLRVNAPCAPGEAKKSKETLLDNLSKAVANVEVVPGLTLAQLAAKIPADENALAYYRSGFEDAQHALLHASLVSTDQRLDMTPIIESNSLSIGTSMINAINYMLQHHAEVDPQLRAVSPKTFDKNALAGRIRQTIETQLASDGLEFDAQRQGKLRHQPIPGFWAGVCV